MSLASRADIASAILAPRANGRALSPRRPPSKPIVQIACASARPDGGVRLQLPSDSFAGAASASLVSVIAPVANLSRSCAGGPQSRRGGRSKLRVRPGVISSKRRLGTIADIVSVAFERRGNAGGGGAAAPLP